MRASMPARMAAMVLLACAAGSRAAGAAGLAVVDVTVVDVETGRGVPHRTVLVEGDRITAVVGAADARIDVDAVRVDGRGRWLVPGLVDMHVHLFNTVSHRPPNDWALPMFVANGITGVREMNADAASIAVLAAWRRETDAGERIAPRVLAAGVAARVREPADAPAAVAAVAGAGADFVKVFSEVGAPQWRAIVDAARERALPVAGHVPASVELLDAATLGQRTDEHLMQAYEACSSIEGVLLRERAGIDGDALGALRDAQEARALAAFDRGTCARVARRLAASGQWQVPTLVLAWTEARRHASLAQADPRWRYLRADERERWLRALEQAAAHPDPLARRRWQVTRAIVSALRAANVPMMAGTDAPMPEVYPGFSLHDELERFVDAGYSPGQALSAATLAPARFLGIEATSGSVAAGKRADLVLLAADPLRDVRNTRRIEAVLLGGRLLRRADLDAVLQDAARRVAFRTAPRRSRIDAITRAPHRRHARSG
ncbi:amidohydrolase family protein [Dokdonella sp.]|uniref:amidohydrolase family protein n=1 Tax=Dokdonella sp. TaxID=2291710 RepID=UPI002F3FEA2B